MARLFKNIHQLLTLDSSDKKTDGVSQEEKNLGIVSHAAIIEDQGEILWVGEEKLIEPNLVEELLGPGAEFEEVDLLGRDVLPGFVECHTHLIFAGDRSDEFEWRNQGVSYQEMSAKGGGILSTVKATREASTDQLRVSAQKRIDEFVRQGVVACEVKSGYGLSHKEEIRLLEVASQLKGPEIVATYLGPHAKSPDVTLEEYFKEILEKTLPEVAARKLARRADIFIEHGFYSREQGSEYFQLAKQLGLEITGHVEQLSFQSGAATALQFGAQSVDHVIEISDDDIQKLAKSNTVCVLLPGADFYLKMKYPKARALIDAGAAVALATDFNPGSCPTQDLSLIGVLARLEMKMTLAEVIIAYTLNAARALNIHDRYGSLEPGKSCDFVVLSDSWKSLFYQVGYHPVDKVCRSGNF